MWTKRRKKQIQRLGCVDYVYVCMRNMVYCVLKAQNGKEKNSAEKRATATTTTTMVSYLHDERWEKVRSIAMCYVFQTVFGAFEAYKMLWIALAISIFEMNPIFSMWLFVCVSQFYPCHFIFVCVFLIVRTFSDVPSPNCNTRIVLIHKRSNFGSYEWLLNFYLRQWLLLLFVIYTYSLFIPFEEQAENILCRE